MMDLEDASDLWERGWSEIERVVDIPLPLAA